MSAELRGHVSASLLITPGPYATCGTGWLCEVGQALAIIAAVVVLLAWP